MSPVNVAPLRRFVEEMAALVDNCYSESELVAAGSECLGELVSVDGWLPDEFAAPGTEYRQYLLHCDSRERFSVVSFVWGPGQCTPIHNHGTWGLIGILRGAELSERFTASAACPPEPVAAESTLNQGAVDAVSPSIGDVHRVRNAFDDRVSVSVHVYGTNIGRHQRLSFREDGTAVPFVSGYSNERLPNIWSQR
jgi:predicted metal-dependent enzyme (double-stranded beta helix superfamily)